MANLPTDEANRKLVRVTVSRRPRAGAVLLADCSSSMDICDTMGGLRRIDHLAQVLQYILSRVRLQSLIAFNYCPFEIPLVGRITLPEPEGGTALDLALKHVLELEPRPTRCIVLCDGEPNNQQAALVAASALAPMPIDAYYVGSDHDLAAADFMARLARAGGPGGRTGKFALGDVYRIGEELILAITDQRGR